MAEEDKKLTVDATGGGKKNSGWLGGKNGHSLKSTFTSNIKELKHDTFNVGTSSNSA